MFARRVRREHRRLREGARRARDYEPLVDTMHTNVDNYDSVSSLPNFNLFAVFFMIPGALIAILAGIGLYAGRERTESLFRPTPTPSH